MTPRQSQLLRYLAEEIEAREGIAPTMQEMCDHLGLKSKAGAHRMLEALEAHGFIRRVKHRARGIEVIRLPAKAIERTEDPSRLADRLIQRFGVREGVLVARVDELCDFLTEAR